VSEKPSAMTQRLDEVVSRRADAIAYRFKGEAMSYREFDRLVQRCAASLVRLSVQPGDRVALMLRNRSEYFVLSHAIWRAGATLVPVNVLLSEYEVAHVLEDSGAVCLIVNGDLAERAAKASAGLPELQTINADEPADSPTSLARFIELGSDTFQPRAPVGQRLAIIAYTSGTTGAPKGAMLDDQHLYEQLLATVGHFDLSETDNFIQFFPVHSVAPNLIGGWTTAFIGSECVLMERFDVPQFAELVHAHSVTCFAMVPTMLLDLLRYQFEEGPDLSSVRYIQVGGAAVPDHLRDELTARFGLPMLKSYGSTECSYVSLDFPGVPPRPGASGQVLPHVEVTIRNEVGEILPTGQTGEICVGGLSTAERPFRPILGYWHDEEKTAQALAGGVFHTGDIGYLNDGGWMYVVDRLKDMIIRGGNNVYPAELETVLNQDERVDDAYVVGRNDERLGEVPVAYIVPSALAGDASPEQIVQTANARLARYKRIEHGEIVNSADLPRTAMNKVLKVELKRWANSQVAATSD
jgi:long-chain acyl-CoA synthetase